MIITYVEKKVKSCLCHLAQGEKDDLDSIFNKKETNVKSKRIEGFND